MSCASQQNAVSIEPEEQKNLIYKPIFYIVFINTINITVNRRLDRSRLNVS